jgi:hypothetical protein
MASQQLPKQSLLECERLVIAHFDRGADSYSIVK